MSRIDVRTAVRGRGSKMGGTWLACYWFASAGIYAFFLVFFYYAGKAKLIDDDGKMPADMAKHLKGTFVASFPGLNSSWVAVGILEGLVFLGVVVSLLAREFLPRRRKPILAGALGFAMLTFGVIAWGGMASKQFAKVAELFQYLAGTGILLLLVLLAPTLSKLGQSRDV